MDTVTRKVSSYIKAKGVNLSAVARSTSIAYSVLYDSLGNENRERELRASELLKICDFLDVDPRIFKNTA